MVMWDKEKPDYVILVLMGDIEKEDVSSNTIFFPISLIHFASIGSPLHPSRILRLLLPKNKLIMQVMFHPSIDAYKHESIEYM